ncbi:MAG: hypothetical protein WA172_19625 [Terriglobales bacterium]
MKMKPTKTILICVLASGLAAAQSPSVIQNTRATMNAVHGNAAAASNAALGIQEKPAASATHAPATSSETRVGMRVGTIVGTSVNGSKTSASKGSAGTRGRGAVAAQRAHQLRSPMAAAKKKTPAVAKEAGSTVSESATADKTVADDQAPLDTKWSGKRDPFISPVVSRANGASSCSTGKKCLEIGTINLRGIVHAESGFIAVVSNSMNKAYFLRENDPVFNGYVVKITGDSIVFQETLQDRLGKTFTREVVKKITTPAV